MEKETKQIILDKSDNITIIKKEDKYNSINIKVNEDGTLTIDGSNKVINNGLEKISRVSNETIINQCDKWLDDFKELYNLIPQNNQIELFCYNCKINDINSYGIDLLYSDSMSIKLGSYICVPEDYKDVYNYLLASTLDYFISSGYSEFKNNEYPIISNDESKRVSVKGNVTSEFNSIFDLVICKHRFGISCDDYLEELKYSITSHSISDIMMKSLEGSDNILKRLKEETNKPKRIGTR